MKLTAVEPTSKDCLSEDFIKKIRTLIKGSKKQFQTHFRHNWIGTHSEYVHEDLKATSRSKSEIYLTLT